MTEKRTSRYAKKVAEGKQMYGNGGRCCAHRYDYVEVHTGKVMQGRKISEIPRRHLPIFTDERTFRSK